MSDGEPKEPGELVQFPQLEIRPTLEGLQTQLTQRLAQIEILKNELSVGISRDEMSRSVREQLNRLTAHFERGVNLIDSKDMQEIKQFLDIDYKNF